MPLPVGASLSTAAPPAGRLRAEGGLLDLAGCDFGAKTTYKLDGEWLFVPGRLLSASDDWSGALRQTVPAIWNLGERGTGGGARGVGSYRLRVNLGAPRQGLGIRYTTVATAFELEVNGVLVGGAGRVGTEAQNAEAAYRPGVVRVDAPAGLLDIVIRVSNHEYRAGGLWRSFTIGDAGALFAAKRARDRRSLVFFAAAIVFALNALAIHAFRPRERSFLYFGLLSLAIALRGITTGEYLFVQLFPRASFELLIRLEYVTAYLAVPAAICYFASLFPDESPRRLKIALLAPFLPFAALIPLAPLPLLTGSMPYFYPVTITAMLAALIFINGRAVVHKRKGAGGMLFGCICLGLAAAIEILFASFLVQRTSVLFIAIALFLLSQSVLQARRLILAFDEVESLSRELAATNLRLEEEIERYREAQLKLEDLLGEKETLLREMHHRVKNSLQLVSSIVGLQANRQTNPAALESFDSLRARIRAVSLVHEKLYGSASGESIDMGEYVRDLVAQLGRSFGAGQSTQVLADVANLRTPMEFCIDLGLALAELVSNAFKHAAVPQGGGGAMVALRREGDELVVEVQDDGPGFPEALLAAGLRGASDSLGFKIVSSIARKHRGELVLGCAAGGSEDGVANGVAGTRAAGAKATLRLRLPAQGAEPGSPSTSHEAALH